MEISGTRCLVTGASRGIGAAVADALEAAGAAEVVRSSSADADLSDPAQAQALAERVGPVDVLVLNAGTRRDSPLDALALEDLDLSFQVNVLSPMVLAGALMPSMRERRSGAVVTVLAPAVSGGRRGMGAYAASKAALASATQTLRQEAGPGVLVLGWDPGWVRTDLAPDGRDEPAAAAARLVELLRTTDRSPREPVS